MKSTYHWGQAPRSGSGPGCLSPWLTWFLRDQEELDQEQERNDVRNSRYFLCLSVKYSEHGVGDQADADGMSDGTGDRHGDHHQSYGNQLFHIAEVHVLQAGSHDDADIDQCGRSRGGRDQRGDR